MARSIATNTSVDLEALLEFVRPRHRMLIATTRRDGRPQISPVSGGVDAEGRIVIATYPGRAKTHNAKRDPRTSVVILSDEWNGAWVQVDGDAEVLDMPEAEDALVDYFRSIAGEHSDWDEYREAMRIQGKSLIRITPRAWGPVATGGFPADVAERLDAQA
ncbi:TIGR03618 family F420-dependent PPOX class oxidoreductase [soil metagenome]